MPGREQRAVGVQVIGGIAGRPARLMGVVTDRDATRVGRPLTDDLPITTQSTVVDKIHQLIRRLQRDLDLDDELVGIGLVVPGLVNRDTVVSAPSLGPGWENYPLSSRLSPLVNARVTLVNDANALAVYEQYFPGRDAVVDPDHFAVMLITDQGIGTGLVLNGSLYEGYRGMAGELGHIAIDDDTECQCGKKGCLQALATPEAIDRALEAMGLDGGLDTALSHPQARVAEVLARAGAALGKGLSTIVNVLNPSTIVIYGDRRIVGPPRTLQLRLDGHSTLDGVVDSGPGHYLSTMMDTMKEHVFRRAVVEFLVIVRAEEHYRVAEAAAACAIVPVRTRRAQRW